MVNSIDADLLPHIYAAPYRVARKQSGFLGAVNANFEGETVNVQSMGKSTTYVKVPVAGSGTAEDYTPAQVATKGGDTTDTEVSIQITKSRDIPWHSTQDEINALGVAGSSNWKTLWLQKMENAMSDLMDEVESDLAGDVYKEASRARGVAGTTPFSSDLSALVASKRELDDNGTPTGRRAFIMSPAASENFLNLNIVQAANSAGSDQSLRTGVMLNHMGFECRVSREISSVTKGTATGYDSNGGSAIDVTTIPLNGSDSGTVLAGDIVTFVGDINKYVVANTTQGISTSATGDMVINQPGLKVTLADTTEGTIGANFTPNIAIQREAYILAVRPPAIAANGYIKSVMQIPDPISGLTFTLVEIPGDGLTTWRVHLAWGFKGINSRFIINYLG